MSDQHEEQYDPASTEGLPEHGRERLKKMKLGPKQSWAHQKGRTQLRPP